MADGRDQFIVQRD